MKKLYTSILFLFVYIVGCECKSYHNYTLFRYIPTDEEHLSFFKESHATYEMNFWRPPVAVNTPIDFVINPAHKKLFLADAHKKGIQVETVLDNVQSAFDEQTEGYQTYERRNMKSFNWNNYARLDDIYVWIRDLESRYPRDITVKTIGKTFEGRELNVVVVSLDGVKNKPKVIIESGVHAREWIGPAFATYLLNEVINAKFGKNEDLKKVAKYYEWHFVPVLNPDGYEFSHVKDRMWRKNRRGIDINRNFGLAFGKSNVTDRNDEEYGGTKAFSENESHALAIYLQSIGKNTIFYLAFHSYGLLMILPYCYTKDHVIDDFDVQESLCKEVSNAIRKRRGTTYTTGTAFDQVGYTATGVSSDWAKKALKIPYVMTFEMNDSGKYGFALPAKEILPTCEETMDGILLLLMKKMPKSKSESKKLNGSGTNDSMLFNRFLRYVYLLFVIFIV